MVTGGGLVTGGGHRALRKIGHWRLEMPDCQAISEAWMRPRNSCQDLRFLLLAQPLHIALVLIVLALLVLQSTIAMDFARHLCSLPHETLVAHGSTGSPWSQTPDQPWGIKSATENDRRTGCTGLLLLRSGPQHLTHLTSSDII